MTELSLILSVYIPYFVSVFPCGYLQLTSLYPLVLSDRVLTSDQVLLKTSFTANSDYIFGWWRIKKQNFQLNHLFSLHSVSNVFCKVFSRYRVLETYKIFHLPQYAIAICIYIMYKLSWKYDNVITVSGKPENIIIVPCLSQHVFCSIECKLSCNQFKTDITTYILKATTSLYTHIS